MSYQSEFKRDAILRCKKYLPSTVTVREYMLCYVLSFYPVESDKSGYNIKENPDIMNDFGMGLHALVDRLTNIYYRIFIKKVFIETKKVQTPLKNYFDYGIQMGDYIYLGYNGKPVEFENIYHVDELSKKWLKLIIDRKKQSTQTKLF